MSTLATVHLFLAIGKIKQKENYIWFYGITAGVNIPKKLTFINSCIIILATNLQIDIIIGWTHHDHIWGATMIIIYSAKRLNKRTSPILNDITKRKHTSKKIVYKKYTYLQKDWGMIQIKSRANSFWHL